jgi:putative Mg2+ transporter-C (MgtC) family protein
MMITDLITAELALKIAAALLLGGVIGWQRELSHKPAGLRTHILIVLGATVVMEVSRHAGELFGGDGTRIAANIVVGIGFIGAGTIMKEGPTVYGLTSAATIWVAGALGTAIGSGYYGAALLLTAATILVLTIFSRIETLARTRCFIRRYSVTTTESDKVFDRIRRALDASHLPGETIDMRREGDRYFLIFSVCETPTRHNALLDELRALTEVVEVRAV